MKRKIITPVAPSGMEIVLNYPCPNCTARVPVIAPINPIKIRCPHCKTEYPVIPADPTSLQYLSLMFANGSALVHPDFI